MNKYKTFGELKEELGDEFEEYMYKANIELLTKIDKAIPMLDELNKKIQDTFDFHIPLKEIADIKEILGDKENE